MTTAMEYRKDAELGEVYVDNLKSKNEQSLVRSHGMAVASEMFDTLKDGVPFNQGDLVGELSTLNHLKPKTQLSIISAVCRWLAAEDDPQLNKIGGKFVLA